MFAPRAIIGLVIGFILLTNLVAVAADAGRIPITTSSPQAREMYMQARLLFEKFKNTEARDLYKQAIAKDPDFALAYHDLAQVEPTFKDYQKDMDRAVMLSSKASDCERNWILSDDAGGKFDYSRQREYLGRLVMSCGDDERAQAALGFYYFGRQYYDSAVTVLQKAVDLAPNFVSAWNMLGYARRNTGDMKGAEQAFQKYIMLSPTDANAYDSYAELLLKEGKYDEAVTNYRRALSVDTGFVMSRFNIAAPLTYQGKYDTARYELNELLHRAKDDGQRQIAYTGLAATYADEGKYDDAVAQLGKAYEISSKVNDVAAMAQTARMIGMLRLEQGHDEDALAQYQKSNELTHASNLAPTIKSAAERDLIYAQTRVTLHKGDIAKAKTLADSFAEKARSAKAPEDLRTMHELYGLIALSDKQYGTAVQEFQQSNLQSGYDLYYLALAYEGNGNHQKAVEEATLAAHINSVPNLRDTVLRQKAAQLVDSWAGK